LTVSVAAPATTANLGSGFDCVALALDLWNELEVEPGEFSVQVSGEGAGELAIDTSNLAVRAFALAADPAGFRFRLLNRIPLERGLGSSAAAIAAGYAAGCVIAGKLYSTVSLPPAAVALDGHADNLAAAFAGGACLTWSDGDVHRIRRLADGARPHRHPPRRVACDRDPQDGGRCGEPRGIAERGARDGRSRAVRAVHE
jgi:homoserine kinase